MRVVDGVSRWDENWENVWSRDIVESYPASYLIRNFHEKPLLIKIRDVRVGVTLVRVGSDVRLREIFGFRRRLIRTFAGIVEAIVLKQRESRSKCFETNRVLRLFCRRRRNRGALCGNIALRPASCHDWWVKNLRSEVELLLLLYPLMSSCSLAYDLYFCCSLEYDLCFPWWCPRPALRQQKPNVRWNLCCTCVCYLKRALISVPLLITF